MLIFAKLDSKLFKLTISKIDKSQAYKIDQVDQFEQVWPSHPRIFQDIRFLAPASIKFLTFTLT